MPKVIDYYFAPMSGYAYLGHARLLDLAKTYEAEVRYHPLNMLKVFAAAGSFPPAKYPDVRQHHRKADMARWADHLNLPINPTPAFWPVPMELACAAIVAAKSMGLHQGAVTGAILAAVWTKDQNIADPIDLVAAMEGIVPDAAELIEKAGDNEIRSEAEQETQDAIELGIFGSPTYVMYEDWYFGQDRLVFLEQHLRIGLQLN